MKIILGIDPGLAATGYGLIQYSGSRFRHISHGAIRTSARDSIGRRLLKIHEELQHILKTFSPTEAGVETIFFARNSKSAMPVAQARGVILFTLAELDISFAEYTPLEVKHAVIGHGKADKRQIQEAIKILLNLTDIPKPEHGADALAVAFCHANYSDVQEYLRSYNEDVAGADTLKAKNV